MSESKISDTSAYMAFFQPQPTGPQAFGDRVACEPFTVKEVRSEVPTGSRMAKAISVNTLTPLKVIFGNEKILKGATVYVRSEDYTQPWAKRELALNDQKFILVPLNSIELVQR